jgi:tRNA(His) guanylyltransferase
MPLYTLKDRIQSYQSLTDIRLMKGLPIIIILNGRSFRKITSLLNKPFSDEFIELMCACMIKLASEIDGVIFVYSFNDEIILVVRNEQLLELQAWYDNKVQKIVSATASITTNEFGKVAKMKGYNILGDPIFICNTFAVPNMIEAMNVLIAKQQQAQHNALYNVCFYELLKKHDPTTVKQTIDNKTAQEKADLLYDTCGIDFYDYNISYRRGYACFRAPKVINTPSGDEIRNKLVIEMSLPIFSKEPEFLENIFKGGKDIIRER